MRTNQKRNNYIEKTVSHVSREGERDFIYNEDKEHNPYAKNLNRELSEELRQKYEYGRRKGESEKQYQKRIKLLNKNKKLVEKELKSNERKIKLGLTFGKGFMIFIMACFGCCVLSIFVIRVYMTQIKYPSKMVIDYSKTGMYCLDNWMESLDTFDGTISSFIGDESYLEKEVSYANNNEIRVDFFRKMLDTVRYVPHKVEEKNKYGNLMIDKDDNVVYRDSYVDLDEEVKLCYVDYSKIEIDSSRVKQMMKYENLSLGDAGYSEKLTDIFCEYMINLKEVPIKEDDSYVPNLYLNLDGTYGLFPEEDIYLDKLLFSSDDFYDLLERFSLAAGVNSINPDWSIWYAYPDSTKSKTEEPEKILEELPITEDWLTWDSSANKDSTIEPNKYLSEYVIGNTWCGSYYLMNEYSEYDDKGNLVKKEILASLGDGSFENPASLGTEVVTVVKNTSDKYNDGEDYPISVRMIEYGVSEDAIKWFESKDERNRGHDIKSEVQYVYYIFEVKNLSNYTLRIKDNSTLCDSGVNLSVRTGIIYGLNDTVTLKPGEVGYIESWSSSINLNKKYIIWGSNFSRENDVVWFRKLAGDLEDTTENKGVTINSSRLGEVVSEDVTEELIN